MYGHDGAAPTPVSVTEAVAQAIREVKGASNPDEIEIDENFDGVGIQTATEAVKSGNPDEIAIDDDFDDEPTVTVASTTAANPDEITINDFDEFDDDTTKNKEEQILYPRKEAEKRLEKVADGLQVDESVDLVEQAR